MSNKTKNTQIRTSEARPINQNAKLFPQHIVFDFDGVLASPKEDLLYKLTPAAR